MEHVSSVPAPVDLKVKSAVAGNGAVDSKATRFGGSNAVTVHGITISLRPTFRMSEPVVPFASSPS
jgi:hypothetical protein